MELLYLIVTYLLCAELAMLGIIIFIDLHRKYLNPEHWFTSLTGRETIISMILVHTGTFISMVLGLSITQVHYQGETYNVLGCYFSECVGANPLVIQNEVIFYISIFSAFVAMFVHGIYRSSICESRSNSSHS